MYVIHKFELKITAEQQIEVPCNARIRHYGAQNGTLYFWAEVDTERPKRTLYYRIVGTGQEFPNDMVDYIYEATVQIGSSVWHIYMKDQE